MKKEKLIEMINKIQKDDISKKDVLYLFPEYNYSKKQYDEYIVYYLLDKDNNVLYIGRTVDITSRMRNHFENPNKIHNREWKNNVVYVKYFELDNFDDMMEYEKGMIKKYSPIYNEALSKTKVCIKEIEEFNIKPKEDFLIKMNIKEEDVINKLKEFIIKNTPNKIVLVDWIRSNFYNEKTKQDTINGTYHRIKLRIKNEINGYTLISKKGRGFKAYLEKY